MRVAADSTLLAVAPGESTGLTIEVVNTDDVIAGVSANIIGLATEYVSAQPQMLPLFPDASGKVHLDLNVPAAHPAGRHPLTVEVVSHGTDGPPDYIDVDLQVAAHPGLRLMARPRIVRARRSGRFVLELANTGNVPLDVTLKGIDPDRCAEVTFTPETRRLEPNSVAPVLLQLRGPRMFTGAEIDRVVGVEATARPAYALGRAPGPNELTTEFAPIPADLEADAAAAANGSTALLVAPPLADPLADPDAHPGDTDADAEGAEMVLVRETSVRLRQKPLVSRGLLTALILLGIIALWAGAFLLGLAKVFAGDPMTKQAPASFFASSAGSDFNGQQKDGRDGAGGGAAGADAAPAGALSKTGQVPPGTGGTITGTVTGAANQQPVGRILVTAFRQGRSSLVEMSSAATQTDGTYALSGLFPTNYYLRFSREGFRDTWFPNQPTQATAQRVVAVAQGKTEDINAVITGDPATITGKVDPGDARSTVTTTVTARAMQGSNAGKVAATTTTSGGSYTLRNLPAPATYELTFATTGYQASSLIDTVSGGDNRIEPTITLGASSAQISGTVFDGTTPLGGATVTTTVAGQTVSVGTPTSGQVGTFVLGNLPTPATYVVTVSAPGHGSSTQIVDLAAGSSKTDTNVRLNGGTGSVTGTVLGPDGKGLGGVTITVGGSATNGPPPTTTTLTAGTPGQFVVNGLPNGSYTLSASSPSFAVASVPVTLPRSADSPVAIQFVQRLSSLEGTIKGPDGTIGGATVTATNGQQTFTTTSTSAKGAYRFASLPPGSYSVTVTAGGYRQQTALVSVGKTKKTLKVTRDISLPKAPN